MINDCVFCDRIQRGEFDVLSGDNAGFVPLNPVTDGHYLVLPRRHLWSALADPHVASFTFKAAAEYASGLGWPVNLITSSGAMATQTVFHFHIHVIPRREGDGLALPWTGQER